MQWCIWGWWSQCLLHDDPRRELTVKRWGWSFILIFCGVILVCLPPWRRDGNSIHDFRHLLWLVFQEHKIVSVEGREKRRRSHDKRTADGSIPNLSLFNTFFSLREFTVNRISIDWMDHRHSSMASSFLASLTAHVIAAASIHSRWIVLFRRPAPSSSSCSQSRELGLFEALAHISDEVGVILNRRSLFELWHCCSWPSHNKRSCRLCLTRSFYN